jgi:hypothetical protein
MRRRFRRPVNSTTYWTVYGYLEELSSQYVLSGFHLRSYTLTEMERP